MATRQEHEAAIAQAKLNKHNAEAAKAAVPLQKDATVKRHAAQMAALEAADEQLAKQAEAADKAIAENEAAIKAMGEG